jgi:hypothetical protein
MFVIIIIRDVECLLLGTQRGNRARHRLEGGAIFTTLPIVIPVSTLPDYNMAALQEIQAKNILLFRGKSMILMLFK